METPITCEYCGHRWTENVGSSAVHITVRQCRICAISGVEGERVRYATRYRGNSWDQGLNHIEPGRVYIISKFRQFNRNRDVWIEGIDWTFDASNFEPENLRQVK